MKRKTKPRAQTSQGIAKLRKYLADQNIGQSEFARRFPEKGVSPGLVWQWLHGHRPVAPQRAIDIERLTDGVVSRADLCPTVYPDHNVAA